MDLIRGLYSTRAIGVVVWRENTLHLKKMQPSAGAQHFYRKRWGTPVVLMTVSTPPSVTDYLYGFDPRRETFDRF